MRRRGEEWPSSWLYANLVAPEYRARLRPEIWAKWNKRCGHYNDIRGLDVDDHELDEEYEDEDEDEEDENEEDEDEEDEDEEDEDEEDEDEEDEDEDNGEAVEVVEVRTRNPQYAASVQG